jgi:hypothetical protein
MMMATAHSDNTTIRLSLFLGMVYQLLACPCGCLEHNGWLDAAQSVSRHLGWQSAHHQSDHHHAVDGHTHATDDGCDHRPANTTLNTAVAKPRIDVAQRAYVCCVCTSLVTTAKARSAFAISSAPPSLGVLSTAQVLRL